MRKLLCTALLLTALTAHAGEWRGRVAGELLGFLEDPASPAQYNSYQALAVEPEYFNQWNGRDDLFTFKPYLLLDSHDSRRTHGDIREFSWLHAARDWETNIGISKVFWGVTEAEHLVDIINQSDLVVDEDGEDKLGQPMAKLSLIRDWGVVDLFVLPGFRARTFPGTRGRPRFEIPISDDPLYESGRKNRHMDFAVRYSRSIGPFDIGLAHFTGTSREPRFVVLPAAMTLQGPTEITPYYELVHQTSLDLQAVFGGWLWKLEAINRTGQGKTIRAMDGGYEYTFVGVLGSQVDVGLITEYLYDSRGDSIDTAAVAAGRPFTISPYQNDLVVGTRLTLNDVAGSELLASVIIDLDGGGQSFNVEASRRFGDAWKLSLEARGVANVPVDNVLYSFSDDTRVRLELARYF